MKKTIFRTVCLITAFVFAVTSVCEGGNFFYSVKVPESCGKVLMRKNGNSKRNIIVIQDAHSVLNAQKNIARIIEVLIPQISSGENKKILVGVEGAVGEINLSDLRAFPYKDVLNGVAQKYLERGIIVGSEYAKITLDSDFTLYGLEDERLFKKNFSAFFKLASMQGKLPSELGALENAFNRLKSKVYGFKLKNFDDMAAAYERGDKSLSDILPVIYRLADENGIDMLDYIYLLRLKEVVSIEERIDFNRAETEFKSFISELGLNSEKYGLNKSDLEYLFNLASVKGVDAGKFLYLKLVCEYKKKFKIIDYEELFREVADISYEIRKKLVSNSKERDLLDNWHKFRVLSKMTTLDADAGDVKYYFSNCSGVSYGEVAGFLSKNIDNLPAVDVAFLNKLLKLSEEFYGDAQKRDAVLADNILSVMDKKGLDTAVVVAGGFHKDGIIKALQNNGVNIILVVPDIGSLTPDIPYIERMSGRLFPIASGFVENIQALGFFIGENIKEDIEIDAIVELLKNISNGSSFAGGDVEKKIYEWVVSNRIKNVKIRDIAEFILREEPLIRDIGGGGDIKNRLLTDVQLSGFLKNFQTLLRGYEEEILPEKNPQNDTDGGKNGKRYAVTDYSYDIGRKLGISVEDTRRFLAPFIETFGILSVPVARVISFLLPRSLIRANLFRKLSKIGWKDDDIFFMLFELTFLTPLISFVWVLFTLIVPNSVTYIISVLLWVFSTLFFGASHRDARIANMLRGALFNIPYMAVIGSWLAHWLWNNISFYLIRRKAVRCLLSGDDDMLRKWAYKIILNDIFFTLSDSEKRLVAKGLLSCLKNKDFDFEKKLTIAEWIIAYGDEELMKYAARNMINLFYSLYKDLTKTRRTLRLDVDSERIKGNDYLAILARYVDIENWHISLIDIEKVLKSVEFKRIVEENNMDAIDKFIAAYAIAVLIYRFKDELSASDINNIAPLFFNEVSGNLERIIIGKNSRALVVINEDNDFKADYYNIKKYLSSYGKDVIRDEDMVRNYEKKELILDKMKDPYYNLIWLNGHGSKEHIWLVNGNIGKHESKNLRNKRALSYLEIAEALKERAEAGGSLENLVIIIDACYSADSASNILNQLSKYLGLPDDKMPLIIASSAYGTTSVMNPEKEIASYMLYNIVAYGKNKNSLRLKDMYEVKKRSWQKQQIAFFVPVEKEFIDKVKESLKVDNAKGKDSFLREQNIINATLADTYKIGNMLGISKRDTEKYLAPFIETFGILTPVAARVAGCFSSNYVYKRLSGLGYGNTGLNKIMLKISLAAPLVPVLSFFSAISFSNPFFISAFVFSWFTSAFLFGIWHREGKLQNMARGVILNAPFLIFVGAWVIHRYFNKKPSDETVSSGKTGDRDASDTERGKIDSFYAKELLLNAQDEFSEKAFGVSFEEKLRAVIDSKNKVTLFISKGLAENLQNEEELLRRLVNFDKNLWNVKVVIDSEFAGGSLSEYFLRKNFKEVYDEENLFVLTDIGDAAEYGRPVFKFDFSDSDDKLNYYVMFEALIVNLISYINGDDGLSSFFSEIKDEVWVINSEKIIAENIVPDILRAYVRRKVIETAA